MSTTAEPATFAELARPPTPAISPTAVPPAEASAAIIPTSASFPAAFGTEAPPPWTLKGDAYWFFPSPTLLPWSSPELLQAAYDPVQAAEAEQHGRLVGGLTNVQLIRYTESPVGPYDELIYVPGSFEAPTGPVRSSGGGEGVSSSRRPSKPALRITRIYVSTFASVVNGRRNWNIPKHLARFAFQPVDPLKPSGPTRVSVFACTSTAKPDATSFALEPFFSVVLTPSILPAFPLKTRYIPLDLRLVMPPLFDGTTGASAAGDELVGTERWASLTPALAGRCQAVWGKGALDSPGSRWADGVGFPDVKPYALGLVWKNVSVPL